MFTSWDKCCSGTASTYNVRVSRASKVTGPYVDQAGVKAVDGGGTLILGSHGNVSLLLFFNQLARLLRSMMVDSTLIWTVG